MNSTPKCCIEECDETANNCDGGEDVQGHSHLGLGWWDEVVVEGDDAELWKVHAGVEEIIDRKSDLVRVVSNGNLGRRSSETALKSQDHIPSRPQHWGLYNYAWL